MSNNFAILLKTYSGDLNYVERLLHSFHKHNVENIPLYIVCPEVELNVFKKFDKKNIFIYSDESITDELVSDDSILGIRPGYINQEIIKLSFWEKKVCDNYFCLDSDIIFIRDFYVHDFMFDKNTPYTILQEDNELIVEPEYYNTHWINRAEYIKKINIAIGYEDHRMLTCHGSAILSAKVLESFKMNFLIKNNFGYKDALRIAPYEYSWYNIWLLKHKTIEIEFREPIIKMFHQKSHHTEYIKKGITLNDISRAYIGYNINSNYSRSYGVVNYEDDIYEMNFYEIKIVLLDIIKSIIRKILRNLNKIKIK